jgi:manganese catalase
VEWPHPETEEELEGRRPSSGGRVPAFDLPSQPAVFAPDYAPEEIAEIAEKLRVKAGRLKEPTGEVAKGKPTRSSKPRRAPRKKAAA